MHSRRTRPGVRWPEGQQLVQDHRRGSDPVGRFRGMLALVAEPVNGRACGGEQAPLRLGDEILP